MFSTGNLMCQKVEPRLWEPVWLWRTTLVAFMVGFTGMWAGLIAVWRYDINNNGYSIPAGAGSSYHYIWTYGPTAILTVVNSLWGKIDYCCKITQPWKEMQNHLADSSKSVQLDYISPFVTTSFYRAVKNRHFAVAASVLGLVILKVIMVASAALLVPSPTEFFRVWPVNLTTKFDDSGFLKAVHGLEGPGAFITTGDSVSQSYFSDSGMAGPLFVFHGLFNASLPYPLGTQKDLAYQLIASPEFGGNVTSISAPVAAFIPNTTCERAQVHFSDSSYYWVNMTLDSPTCSAGYFSTGQIMPTCAKDCGIANQSWADSYSVLRVNCSEDKTFISGVQIPLDNQLKDDLRFAFVAANFSWSLNSSTTGTAAVCKFDYGIRNATLEQGLLTNTIKLKLSGDTGNAYKLSNLTSLQLAEFIYTIASAPEYSLSLIDGFGTQLADPLSAVVTWTLKGPVDVTHKLHRLFDIDTLAEAARITLDGLSIQLMHQFFLVPDPASTIVNGTIEYSEQRIHVQPISLWLMVAGFIVLSILTLTIQGTRPDRSVPGDPGTIASLVAILSVSKSMQDLLQGAGGLRAGELRRWLGDHVFMTEMLSGRFRIQAVSKKISSHKTIGSVIHYIHKRERNKGQSAIHHTPLKSENSKRKPRSLILLSSRSFKAVLRFALPLISIGLLELLWQMSKTSGLRDASDISSNFVRYSTSLVAAIIAIIFNNLDFSIKTVTPYSRLRFVDSSPQSLTCNLLGRIPVSALYRSLRDTNLGAAFSSLASIVASFLTIISSGLWVVEPIELSAGVRSWSGTTWDLAWTNSSIYDDGAESLLNRIQRNGSSVPKGIWKDLVLPEILHTTLVDEKTDGRFNLSDDGVNNKTRVSLTVAALRPQLECNAIPQGKIKLINEDVGTIVDTTHNLPASCHWSPGGNVDAWFAIDWDISWDNSWGTGFYDLYMGPYQSSVQHSEMRRHQKNPNGCPSVVVLLGYIDKEDTSAQNMSVLVCSQKIQQVQTRLILKPDRSGLLGLDDFVSDPEPIESTSENLRDEEGADTFNYRVQNRVDFRLRDINNDNLSSLLGPGHIDDLGHAANNAYNAYMVQVINKPIFRRVEADPFHLPKQQLFGNVTTTTSRLSIDCTSKIVLQVILAVVIGLGILAFCLIDTESTLPRDPLSIASVMALLAGSRLCSWRYMPADAEWMDTPQFEKAFRGMSFSLGWWKMSADTGDQRDATDLRFGIDVGKADKLGYR